MSARESFDRFVQRQQEQSVASKAFDYQAEKKQYIALLEQLYAQIHEYLNDYIHAGTVRLESSTVKLDEEGIGSYDAPSFIIIIGTQQIKLTPIGTLLIGSKGRVDVVGRAGTVWLTLVDRHAQNIRDVVRVTVNIVEDGERVPDTPPAASAKEVDWTWKIVITRAFREIYAKKGERASLEQDILEVWRANTQGTLIGDLKGAFRFRHWLTHGRYWVPKLGRKYDHIYVYDLAVGACELPLAS